MPTLYWDPYTGYYVADDGTYAYDPYAQNYYGYQPQSGWQLLMSGLQALQWLFPQAGQQTTPQPQPPAYQQPQPAPAPSGYRAPIVITPNPNVGPVYVEAPGSPGGKITMAPTSGSIPVAKRLPNLMDGNWEIAGDEYEAKSRNESLIANPYYRQITTPIKSIKYPDGRPFPYPPAGIYEGIKDPVKGRYLMRFENPNPDWWRKLGDQIRHVPVRPV